MVASPPVIAATYLAQWEALRSQWEFVEPDHLFLGILKLVSIYDQQPLILAEFPILNQLPREALEAAAEELKDLSDRLRESGAPSDPVRYLLRNTKASGGHPWSEGEVEIHRSQASHRVFRRAAELALGTSPHIAHLNHFVLALLEDRPVPGEELPKRMDVLSQFKVDVDRLRSSLRPATGSPDIPERDWTADGPDSLPDPGEPPASPDAMSPPGRVRGVPGNSPALGPPAGVPAPNVPRPLQPDLTPGGPVPPRLARPTPFLDRHGKDLTRLAREGEIHPPVGRKREMLDVVRVLSQTAKNCPVLVGDAGVGKTAVVEGLAWRIAQGRAPTAVAGKRIIQLDLAGLVAGTQYRGEFEQRLQSVLQEATDSPDVILFLDEVHTVVGAGSGSGGPMDAANILKPALGRGTVRLIGATTLGEYRKHIEKDAALERRFEPIVIAEPTAAEALEILLGIRERLQQHHQVTIQTDALEAAINLAVKYVLERRLPDKAIDLLEKACSSVAVRWTSALPGEEEGPQTPGIVTEREVAQVVAQRTGIPVAELTSSERQRLSALADDLKRRVIGQDEACDAVAQALQRARLGMKADDHPIGVLLLVGPTGVGKTELARATAACVFGGAEKLVRLDMSEFMEKHTVARLTGAPPGYIGHDEEGQLTGALRRNPHCVVLLDEIEKAHADVLGLFLQVFDAGRLTDASGRMADATNALFLLTSNLPIEVGAGLGLAVPSESQAREALLKHNLRPELVNRLDRVISFRRLVAADMQRICARLLEELREQLRKRQFGLEWDADALALLAQAGQSDMFGARELRRVIERQVKDRIAAEITRRQIQTGQVVRLHVRDGELAVS
jgi:ATP-dependent Clp protease ATP-binding subunit ClpC